jgi:hypothetical protein
VWPVAFAAILPFFALSVAPPAPGALFDVAGSGAGGSGEKCSRSWPKSSNSRIILSEEAYLSV